MNRKGDSGAVTEEDFRIAFNDTPESEVSSTKELKEAFNTIRSKLDSDNWQSRVEYLKILRGIVKAKNFSKEELLQNLKLLDIKHAVSDLRSQIVREACITVAYFACEFKTKLEFFLEPLIEPLLNLVPSGTKIMSSSGKTALKFIVNNTQSSRLLPFFTSSMMTSKSMLVRQYSAELVKIICETWSIKALDKNSTVISEALKKGISDADVQARAFSREAFCWFNAKFPNLGSKLLQSLDGNKQKMLQKELLDFTGTVDETDSRQIKPAAEKKLFKVPQLTGAKSTAPSGMKSSNVSVSSQRSRVNSARSESNSASNSTEYLYTKPSYNYGLHRNSTPGKTKVTQSKAVPVSDTRGRRVGKVSQSQPSTRDTSPASKTSYITYTNGGGEQKTTSNFQKGRSPTQYNSLRYKSEFAGLITDKLNRHRQNNDPYQSDDNVSEVSSVVSDQLISFNEFLPLLTSKTWGDRKRGLIKAEKYLLEGHLKLSEKKALIDVFNSMFLENQSAVVKQFLSVLYVFIDRFHEQLLDWAYTLIHKLMITHANDKLRSSKLTVQRIFRLIVEQFGAKVVFAHCCKFIVDKNHDPTLKVKLSWLEFVKDLLVVAPPNILETSNSDFQPTLGTILVWTSEAKSTELRKNSSNIIVKLFDLNSSQFFNLIANMPSTFQTRATEVLRAYVETMNPANVAIADKMPENNDLTMRPEDTSEYIRDNVEALQNMSINCDNVDNVSSVSASSAGQGAASTSSRSRISPRGVYQKSSNVGGAIPQSTNQSTNARSFIPAPSNSRSGSYQHQQQMPTNPQLYTDTDNNSPFDVSRIHKYLHQVSHPELTGEVRPNYNIPAGIPNSAGVIGAGNLTNHLNPSNDSNIDSTGTGQYYNPDFYNSGPIDTRNIPQSSSKLPPEDVLQEILKELCNYNERHEERKACLFKLIKMFRENSIRHADWDEHFKTLLFVLMETMADDDADIRAQSLRVLQELTRSQADRLNEYSQLVIVRVLEAHRDSNKSVVKAAEECSKELSNALPRETCLDILIGAISEEETTAESGDGNSEQNQLCLPALKMLSKLIKMYPGLSAEYVTRLCTVLSVVINHTESQVRKETVLCLVEIYRLVKEQIWSLVTLTSSQKRLIEVYINKYK